MHVNASMKSSELVFLKPETLRISGRLHSVLDNSSHSGHFRATQHLVFTQEQSRWYFVEQLLEEYPTTVPRLPPKKEKTRWNLHIKPSSAQVSRSWAFTTWVVVYCKSPDDIYFHHATLPVSTCVNSNMKFTKIIYDTFADTWWFWEFFFPCHSNYTNPWLWILGLLSCQWSMDPSDPPSSSCCWWLKPGQPATVAGNLSQLFTRSYINTPGGDWRCSWVCLKIVCGPFISRWLPTKDINHICWGSLENLLRCLESTLPDANEVTSIWPQKNPQGFHVFW